MDIKIEIIYNAPIICTILVCLYWLTRSILYITKTRKEWYIGSLITGSITNPNINVKDIILSSMLNKKKKLSFINVFKKNKVIFLLFLLSILYFVFIIKQFNFINLIFIIFAFIFICLYVFLNREIELVNETLIGSIILNYQYFAISNYFAQFTLISSVNKKISPNNKIYNFTKTFLDDSYFNCNELHKILTENPSYLESNPLFNVYQDIYKDWTPLLKTSQQIIDTVNNSNKNSTIKP
jgi:hypothetical protein